MYSINTQPSVIVSWYSLTGSNKKLAITPFSLLAKGTAFSNAFLSFYFLSIAIILKAGGFAAISKKGPHLFDHNG